jgi:two-component system, OmpR family, sensor histidine kinase TctE
MTGEAGVQQAWRSFWRAQSLRRRLLTLLLPSLVLITVVELALSYRLAQQTIDEAYDRGLKGAVQALSLATSMDDGGFSVDRPFKLLSYVQSNSRGTVFFHVRTSDGLMEAGFAGLNFPWPGAVMPDTVYLAEGLYFDQNLRMAAIRREIVHATDDAESGAAPIYVDLLVAEDLAPRQAYLRSFLLRAAVRDGLLLLFTMAVLVWMVGRGLAPLGHWSRLVRQRPVHDLTPLPMDQGLPEEARPLVEALNFHLSRSAQEQATRQRFLEDASHQLRTPLAVLKTQIAWRREQQKNNVIEPGFLTKLEAQVDSATRHTQQMLQLARVEHHNAIQLAAVPLLGVVQAVVLSLQPFSQRRHMDMGLAQGTGIDAHTRVWTDAGLLQQVLENLLDNAIKYGRTEGIITVHLELGPNTTDSRTGVWLEVEDDGPGVSDETLSHLGERFYRADQASQRGSGLGLSIVSAVLTRLGSHIEFARGTNQQGLRVRFWLPLNAPPERGMDH